MARIQFYPGNTLLNSLNSDAARLGAPVSTLVTDILKRHYGLVPPTSSSQSVLNSVVFDEVRDYVAKHNCGDVFDLINASPTYAQINMTYAGKPSVVRAKIGKTFAKSIGSGNFARVSVNINKNNGKIVRSVNNAATYIIL